MAGPTRTFLDQLQHVADVMHVPLFLAADLIDARIAYEASEAEKTREAPMMPQPKQVQ